jgi:uncharacterized membrane protein
MSGIADTVGMDEQQYRERLARDAAAWRRDGLISETQERAILARYGAGEAKLARALRMGWLVSAVSIIGALVLGAGVVLLFAANWEEMPDSFRTALVFGAMLVVYGLAYALMYRFDMQRTGSALLLLGALLYQAGLFLLAQIYNMPVESPIILLLGAAGAAPLAYFFGSRIIMLLAVADATAWVVWELARRYPDSPESWAALIVVGVFGVGLYAAGRLHAVRPSLARMGDAYVLGGALVVLSLVYCFTFVDIWDEIVRDGVDIAPGFVYIAIALAAALALAQLALRPRDLERGIDVGAQLALLAIAAVVATWPAWTGYAVVFNAVFFAIAAGLVARGYARSDERYVNAGLAAVGVGLISRYVDTFWSLLAGSAFYMIGGVLLLALAFAIERVRRDLLREMDGGHEPPPSLPQEEVSA